MRRHPPRLVELTGEDRLLLERLIRDGHTGQHLARRARILLEMTDPATIVQELASRLEVTSKTIWNVCRRYEAVGIDGLEDASRSGRPRKFSPPAAC